MKTDLNSNIQEKLEKRSSIKKKRTNTKRVFLALNLVAAIFTTTVFSNPVSVMSEEVSADAVQSIENSAGGDEQIAEQADAQQNTAEAAQAAEAPAAENSAEAVKAEEPSGVNAPAENAMSAEMSAAEDGVVSADDGAASASAVQSAGASSVSNGLFEDAGADNTDGIQDGIIEDSAEGLNEAEGAAADETAGDAASQEQLTYEDEHVKISASCTDGRAFPADSILNGTYLDSDEKNAVLSAVNAQISKDNSANTVSDPAEQAENSDSAAASTATTTVEYSVAGFHALMLAAKNQEGSDAITEGDISFSVEFRNGLNDAGYASREETTENNEAARDGSLTATTTRCETSWKIYTVTEKNVTDLTDAHNTHFEMDKNGALKSASFHGELPQTVAFVQIVKKTVIETAIQRETEKVTEKESQKATEKNTERITETETEKVTKATEKTTETEKETEDVKEEVSASAAMPAVTFDQKVNTENGTVMVHVDAEEGAFEDGTSMAVTPVTRQDILDKAIDAAGGKGAAAAMDITFMKPDGTKTEPLKPIHVKMISPVLNRAEEAHVVHVADSGSTDVVAKKSDGKTIESTSSDANSSDTKNTVSFESDSFSVYAIVYTVDFSFSGYTYSIKGGSSILLSSLAEKLGLHDSKQNKDFSIADVDDVTFSDSSLVEVTKKDGDWELESRKPFTSTEKLTISMKDGSRYEVEVRDADDKKIAGNLTNATIKIDGQEVTGNTWKVKAGSSYAITLYFAENKDDLLSQFPNDETWMVYKLPDGLQVENLNNTFAIDLGGGKSVEGNTWIVDKATRRIKVKWNTADPNFEELKNANEAEFHLTLQASFGSDVTEVKFSDSVTRVVNVDKTHNASVQKSGYYDQNDGKIHYTVMVTSTGTSENVNVTDTVTGTALKYDGNVTYTSTKDATATAQTKDNGFTATIPSMSDGETVTFNYTASVDFDKLTGNGNEKETANGVMINCPDDNKPDDNSATYVVNSIPYSSIGKNAQSVGDTYKENGKTYRNIRWKITANTERKKHLTYISDSIAGNSQGVLSYSGEGLTIVVTHEDGSQETRKVDWTDSSIQKTDTGWKYMPLVSDGKASYDVTYTTKADVTNLIDSRNVSNGAQTDYSSTTGSATVGPSRENQFNASKKATAVSSDKVTWEITIDVPASGLDKLVVTDTLPTQYVNNHNVYDLFDKIKGITGLDGSEDYSLDKSDPSEFVLTFYKDKAHKNAGMNSSDKKRTVTISYTTTVNQEWVEYSGQHKGDMAYLMTHINKATVSVPGIDKGIEAQVTITNSEQAIKKTGTTGGTYTDTDGSWQYYSYDIVLSGVTEDSLTLEDTFDTTHLRYFDGVWDPVNNPANKQWDAGYIWGGDQNGQYNGQQKVTVQETSTGIKINTDTLPHQNGAFYTHYRIHYYLKARLDDLQKLAAKEGGTTTLRNSVKWGTQEASADVSYSYPGINKTCQVNGNVATYTIETNPGALELNDGKPMQLVDTFTNQSIDYSTITITKATDTNGKDRRGEISYYFSGNTVTFTIPDSTHVVITYQAKPVGTSGSSVKMTNTAEMKAYKKEISQSTTIQGSAGGSASVAHLKLLKYAKNHMETKLSGAVFQLFDENGKKLKYDKGDKSGQDITFTTGADGYADISLSVDEYSKGLNFNTKYILRETTAPAGYQVASGDIPFTISKDGSSDPQMALYANGSTVAVADKKITEVSVTLTKTDADSAAKTLPGAVFDLYGSDYIGSDGKVNASAQAVAQNLYTGEGGTVSLGTLKGGTYYLVETKAPDGYAAEPDPITLTVSDESVTVRQGTAERKSDIKDTDTGQTANITVTDSVESKYELPSTGGSGDLPWVASGILLILLAGAVLTVRKLLIYRSRGRGGGLRS